MHLQVVGLGLEGGLVCFVTLDVYLALLPAA